ncbi:prepilin peptidase [Kordiimonas sp.]|uniref:prepilin peptidase n=1 Tax=Kordiimonas sp. TaxID=1970157 RepID=UPI003A8D9ED7
MTIAPVSQRAFYAVIFLLPFGALAWSDRPVLISTVLYLNLYALALYDQFTFRLPNLLTATLLLTGLLHAYMVQETMPSYVLGAAAGFLSLWGLSFFYLKLRGRHGLGMGDAKFLAGAGAWVGWFGLPPVLLVAALAGLGAFLLKTVKKRQFDPQQPIPFGPCLCFGTWLIWLFFAYPR